MRPRLEDRVRVDISDELNPGFKWHGEHELVIDINEDELGQIYSVGLEDHYVTIDARTLDLLQSLRNK